MDVRLTDDLSSEDRPVGQRRLLNRLAVWLNYGKDGTVDLIQHNVRVDGHRISYVSANVARDLLNAPFASPAEQARTLQAILSRVSGDGFAYMVPIVRTRVLGRTTVAQLYITRDYQGDWRAYWWYES
jgi:hypothetical protein